MALCRLPQIVWACALVCLPLVSPALLAQPGKPAEVDVALLRLGIGDAITQLDSVIRQTVNNLPPPGSGNIGDSQLATLQQILQQQSGTDSIRQAAGSYVASHWPDGGEQAIQLLNEELVSRVRNFDVALEMRGAAEKFDRFRETLKLDEISAERKALLQRLDSALQSSALAAMLQTELAISAELMAAQLIDKAAAGTLTGAGNDVHRQRRQQHMAEVLLVLNLYSYRFLPDQELESYVRLLEQPSVQSLLAICRQALSASLLAARVSALEALAAGR